MRKTILTILATTLLAGATVQTAAAAEHHRAHKVYRAPVVSEPIRNSNDYYGAPSAYSDWSRYSGGISAPAGH
jgi:hypothetical protein